MKKLLLFFSLILLSSLTLFSQVTTVGLIGSGTPNGWDSDIDMTRSTTDTAVWTLNVDLVNGAVKFRANNDWAINWGSTDFPKGTGTQNGPDIPVFAGKYYIIFNSVSGEYDFQVESAIGIIGSATAGNWDYDTNMYKDTSAHGYFLTVNLKVGDVKFRKDDAWTRNWGAVDFPSGIGVNNGPNIPIAKAGKYFITFDTLSGAYNFAEKVDFEFIGLIGDATPKGWDADTDLTKDGANPDLWKADIQLTNGSVKFRANHAWTINWGGTTFPAGTGIPGGDNIAVTEGKYRVSFNTATLAYNFQKLENYTKISLIGNAVPGGENWDKDLDLTQSTEDSVIWKGTYELVQGEAKFRANHDWTFNWGGPDFPAGTGVQEGANIPVAAGRYKITFNSLTGAYNFEAFVVYDQISIVGLNGPANSWDVDTYLTISPENDQIWTGKGFVLTTADPALSDNGIKFRANSAWTVNWGNVDHLFPSGIGAQDKGNIWCTAGTWDVVFNTLTGEYVFTASSATHDILDPSVINVYPNPTAQDLNIDLSAMNINENVSIKVFDMSGKMMMSGDYDSNDSISLDVSGLNAGGYFINIVSEKFIVGKQFSILK
ncbi:MAG: SusF/SusE family outer membrane protein [Saprospiraceae bacterium]|nr:SusF/SusE family outer membrane protein [Saprospiraceae bacterium]